MLANIGLHYNSLFGISIKILDGNPWLQDFAGEVEGDVLKTVMDKTPDVVWSGSVGSFGQL